MHIQSVLCYHFLSLVFVVFPFVINGIPSPSFYFPCSFLFWEVAGAIWFSMAFEFHASCVPCYRLCWIFDLICTFSFGINFSDERESVQKKTFQKWVNSHLVRVGNRIGDLYTDLRDGKMLLKLLEVLSGERLVRSRHGYYTLLKYSNDSS